MFLIDKTTNSIQSLSRKTFSELGFKERAHLQEWIAGNPECLGEKLLIIQKEFSDLPKPMKDSTFWRWVKMATCS